jgi:aspartate/methionine/tyrosine aminotransferase
MSLRPFELERYFAKYEFNTRLLLSSSDCESRSVDELLSFEPDASEKFRALGLGYIDSRGGPELREAIAGIYGGVFRDEILCFSGAEEAIFLFMHAVLAAGDEIVVHQPCYQALAEVPRALGAKVVPWLARAEEGWALDQGELEKLVTAKTRAIVVNLPHNPTGYLMPAEEFRKLAAFAESRGVVLFCDEVYRESEYQAAERLPAACELTPSAVSLGVLSKSYGLAGLRIGWVATRNAPIRERMAELKDYTTICNSAPSEFLAALALRHRAKLTARNLELIASNLKLLDRFFKNRADRFTWTRPKAGPIGFPKAKDSVRELCRRAVTEAGVMLLPGFVFGSEYDKHFRLGFGRKNMPEALAALEKFLA